MVESTDKKITIQIPPKAHPKIYPQGNRGKAPKYFDCVCNKCGGKCCMGQCEDWPKVGDKVYVTKKVLDNNSTLEAASLISETYCHVVSKFTHNEVEFCTLKNNNSAYTSLILDLCITDNTIVKSKPKTPEEELRDDLFNCKKPNLDTLQAEDLSKWLIANYDIKKKP